VEVRQRRGDADRLFEVIDRSPEAAYRLIRNGKEKEKE